MTCDQHILGKLILTPARCNLFNILFCYVKNGNLWGWKAPSNILLHNF